MNKVSEKLEIEQYKKIIETIRIGFIDDNHSIIRPNDRIATALVLLANTGIPISFIRKLKLEHFKKDKYGYLIVINDINFAASNKIYDFLKEYADKNKLNIKNRLFDLSTRAIGKHLNKACVYLGYKNITIRSFKEMFTDRLYDIGCKSNMYMKFRMIINNK